MTGSVAAHDPTAELRPGLRALEASAGTGKTWQITSGVLRLVVEQGATPEQFLVVTFTRAATEELGERVRSRLAEGAAVLRAALDGRPQPDDLDVVLQHLLATTEGWRDEALRRVEDALRDVDQATVTTIHGFCQRVLAAAAFLTGTDVHVELDERDAALVEQVVADHRVALLHDADPRVLAALAAGGVTVEQQQRIGRAAVGEPDLHIVPDGVPPVDRAVTALLAAWDRLQAAVADHGDDLVAAGQAAVDAKEQPGNGKWKPATLRRIVDEFGAALERGDVPQDGSRYAYSRHRVHPDGEDGGMPTTVGATVVVAAVAGFDAAMRDLTASVRVDTARHASAEVARRRGLDGSAGYTDLLRRAADALESDLAPDGTPGPLHAELRQRYAVVLVDEFQDTDPLQWRVLRGLFDDGATHLEVVGDPKQSIYGWRGADLDTYFAAVDAAGDRRTTMTRNFRSDAPYVSAMNRVMDHGGTFTAAADGRPRYVEVDASAPVSRLRDPAGAAVTPLVLVRHDRPGPKPMNKDDGRRAAARATADEIDAVLRAGWTIDGSGERRGVGPGDLAVLVRRNADAQLVATELQRRDVPVVIGGGDDVLASVEAVEVGALLECLLVPRDERALRRVLVGPIGGLTTAELAGLGPADWDRAAEQVSGWLATWDRVGVAAAIERALRDRGAETRLMSVVGGDRTVTNLRHVAELLQRAEREEAFGHHALATWLADRRAAARDGAGQAPTEREVRLERDARAVRVMTVHTAKGLQFPLVWVPFAWDSELRSGGDGGDPFVVADPADPHHRRTLVLAPTGSSAVGDSDEVLALRRAQALSEWEAGHRLLYVALTRAVHRCVVHVVPNGALPHPSAHHLFLRRSLGPVLPGASSSLPTDADLQAALDELSDGSDGLVEVRGPGELPPAGPRVGSSDEEATDLAARTWHRSEPLVDGWTRASFTGLLRSRGEVDVDPSGDDARDHDETAPDPAHVEARAPAAAVDGGPVLLADLPRGPAVGTYVHDVFEHLSFDAEVADVAGVARQRLGHHGDVALDAGQVGMLADGVHAALRTPIGGPLGGLRLCDVGPADRLDELEFVLGLGERVRLDDVADVFEAHADDPDNDGVPLAAAAQRLRGGRPVTGLLTGFVDLVLRDPHGGVWVVDYKTNTLGERVDAADGPPRWDERIGHHHPDRVMAQMVEGDYLLQAHLYAVAVRRWLRSTGGTAPPLRGWAYLFVRGMVGGSTPVLADGRRYGVATGTPSEALLDALDGALGGDA